MCAFRQLLMSRLLDHNVAPFSVLSRTKAFFCQMLRQLNEVLLLSFINKYIVLKTVLFKHPEPSLPHISQFLTNKEEGGQETKVSYYGSQVIMRWYWCCLYSHTYRVENSQ